MDEETRFCTFCSTSGHTVKDCTALDQHKSTDDRVVNMTFDNKHLVFSEMTKAELAVPKKGIPVMAMINGRKVLVGEGHINPETLIFTTKMFDGEPNADIFINFANSLDDGDRLGIGLIEVSEVTFKTPVRAPDGRNS